MKSRRRRVEDHPDIPIAPMIDCVFLLLVYFMVSSSLDREEWALPVALPGSSTGNAMELPEEQIVLIDDEWRIWMNEAVFDDPSSEELPQLTAALLRFRQLCEAAGGDGMVTLVPEAGVPQQRIIHVLDALQRAGVERVYFGKGSDSANNAW